MEAIVSAQLQRPISMDDSARRSEATVMVYHVLSIGCSLNKTRDAIHLAKATLKVLSLRKLVQLIPSFIAPCVPCDFISSIGQALDRIWVDCEVPRLSEVSTLNIALVEKFQKLGQNFGHGVVRTNELRC